MPSLTLPRKNYTATGDFSACLCVYGENNREETNHGKNRDLSDYTKDELTALIDEATNLRTTKFEGDADELRVEREKERLQREIDEDRVGIGSTVTRL